MTDSRHYENPLEDFSQQSQSVNGDGTDLHDVFREKLSAGTKTLLQKLEHNKKHWDSRDDCSLYTGLPGVAFAFYHYGMYFDDSSYTSRAAELIARCGDGAKGKRHVTFLTGNAGLFAVGAVMYHSHGDREECDTRISKLRALSSQVLDDGRDVPDELLYGRAGYLYALLYVNQNVTPAPFDDALIKEIIACILNSGQSYSKAKGIESPIMYSWHDSEYLGGAHGLAGILYLLLQARKYLTEAQLKDEIAPALRYLDGLKYPSGNFPSSVGRSSDKLVHWCHGAPSMTALFGLAYEIFKEDRYLNTALQCGEVIWKRGLLKKGYGICHGVAGNAYTFLNLYQLTKDAKHLHRACKFAEWCLDYGTHQTSSPDRPFSLFEGLAGTVYFLIDLQKPNDAKFPGYTL